MGCSEPDRSSFLDNDRDSVHSSQDTTSSLSVTVSSSSTQHSSSSTNSSSSIYIKPPQPVDFNTLFDNQTIPLFNIIISDKNLSMLDADPKAEEYVSGSLEYGNELYTDIEVRYKGSVGSWLYENTIHTAARQDGIPCTDKVTTINDSIITYLRPKICLKLGLKLKFNTTAQSDQRFKGLKKLQLHSLNNDPSQMREQLGYWMYREMGVRAPRTSYARVQINSEDLGLFLVVENIDGIFTRQHFTSGEGNVYKQIMPVTIDNKPQSASKYIATLRTNENDNPSALLMTEFAQDLQAANDSTITQVIRKWIDVEEIIANMLVTRVLDNWDSPWCLMSFAGTNGKNYFWYEDPTRKKFTLIPWDLDNILHAHPLFDDFFEKYKYDDVGVPMAPLPLTDAPAACSSLRKNQQCNALMRGLTLFEKEYLAQLEIFRQDVYPQLAQKLDEWQSLITPITLEMNDIFGDPTDWPNTMSGNYGSINKSYWLEHVEIVRKQIMKNSDAIMVYGK